MKSKVHFSTYCIIITILVLAALTTGILTHSHYITATAITLAVVAAGLYYCPVSVSVNTSELIIHRLLSGDKKFSLADIVEVDTCYPSIAGIRLCGSGGFFGYWGYFSDITIGQYFGYYADRSQCFYIKLKNKRQYVISCENHIEMVKAIRKISNDRVVSPQV
ncbi:MAG: PH domain-containing protein [Duncaniella sp.]|nr:PH domain-containing protein [Duncaniella sp.]MDE6205408.1 PH domain-containing protein [Duncaniella sp.]